MSALLGVFSGASMALLALKAFVMLGLGWVAVLGLRRANAATRHLVWALTFAGLLALPVASALVPSWSVLPVGSRSGSIAPQGVIDAVLVPAVSKSAASGPAVSRSAASGPAVSTSVVSGLADSRPATSRTIARVDGADSAERGGAARGAAHSGTFGRGAGASQAAPPLGLDLGVGEGLATLLLMIWAAGVVARLAVLWSGVGRVSWLARRARPLADAKVQAEADAAAADLGLSSTPAILIGDDAPVPMTWGVVSPRILLPAQAQSWPLDRLRRVLLHETAHVARRDLIAQWIGEIACALYWFNPLVWMAAARMRMEREHASDDLVLSRGVRASDYAEDLLEIVRGYSVPPVLAGAAGMARPSQLGERLRAVLDPSRRRGVVGGAVRAAALTVGTTILMGAAALGPSAAGADGTEPASLETPATSPSVAHAADSAPGSADSPVAVASATSAVSTAPERPGERSGEPSWAAAPTIARTSAPAPALADALCPYPVDDDDHDPEYGVLITDDGGRVRGTMINSSGDDGMVELSWTGRDCTVHVSMPQATRFNDAETDVRSVPSGGEFEAEFRSRALTRRVVVSSDLSREYFVDGAAAPWDASAREWMADLVVTIFRRTGHQAEERAARILRAGGLDALVTEIALLHTGFVSAEYIGVGYALVETDDERRRLLTLAAETVDGDYRLGKVLTTAAEAGTMSAALRRDFIRTAGLLEGDYEMGRVFGALLDHQEVGRDGLFQILEEARENLEGDYEMSRLYQRLLDDRDLDLELARLLVESASRNLDGDYEKSRVIRAVAERDDLGAGVVREVMAALPLLDGDHAKSEILEDYAAIAGSPADLNRVIAGMAVLDGDHARGEVLRVVLDSEHFGPETFGAVMGALSVMGGHQTQQTVTRMVRDYELGADELVALIDLAAEQGGHNGSQIMTQIARTGRVEGRVRDAFVSAAERFSDHEQDRILAALVRGGGD